MPLSQNGWTAAPDIALRPLIVNGVEFIPGIRDDDAVETVLRYVLAQYDQRVEPLVNPGCWGFSFRDNANDPSSLSNHSSATAVDANAPAHPNGVPTLATFSREQVDEIHKILAEVDHVVRWGGDYEGTPDAMHFEINADRAAVVRVAQRLEDDMFSDEDRALLRDTKAAAERAAKVAERAREGSYKRDKALIELARATQDDVDTIRAKVKA